MGMFEYFFERKRPKTVGSIDKNKKSIPPIRTPLLLFKLVVSIGMLAGIFYATLFQNLNIINTIIFIIALLIYCFISYNYIPQPNYSNMGLFGGLIDHPFKFSDDVNRMLRLLLVLLYPGRFIATTMIQTLIAVRRLKK